MSSKIKLSIVIPVFNIEGFIRETLDSIMAQNCEIEFEILVVDDHSTDNTVKVCQELSARDPRLKLFSNERTKGAAGCRNTGLLKAQGEWVAFLDGDDVLLDGSLRKRLSAIADRDDIDFVGSGYCEWYYEDEVEHSSRDEEPLSGLLEGAGSTVCLKKDLVIEFLRYPTLAWTGAVMVRRDLFAEAGFFNEELVLGEDRDLWLRLAAISRGFLVLNEDLVRYRMRKNSLTRQGVPGSIWAVRSVLALIRKPEFRPYRAELSRKISAYQLKNSYYFRRTEQHVKAIKASASAIRYHPADIRAWKSLIGSCLRF